MGAKDLRRELAMRRIWEGVIATVLGGLILWSVTSSMSRPAPTTERMAVTAAPATEPTATPNGPLLATSARSEAPAPRMCANLPPLASIPGPMAAMPAPKENLLSYSVPVGSILLYEDFSHYREGDATGLGAEYLREDGPGSPQLAGFRGRRDASGWS